MKKYEVTVDFVCTATIVVEARDEESAEKKAMRYVHTKTGFERFISVAAPLNATAGFDVAYGPTEFDGTIVDGMFEI